MKKLYVVAILILFLVVRLSWLGNDMSNSDAKRWHKRSEDFLTGIKTSNFKETYQRYHPGVTLMWTSAFVKQVSYSVQFKLNPGTDAKTYQNFDFFPFIDGLTRAFIVVALFCLFCLHLWLIKNLSNFETAIVYGMFVATEPYLIGIDRWLHLTSLESYLCFASFLLLMLWHKTTSGKLLILSSLIFGLAALTKLSAFILLPLLLGIILYKFYDIKAHISLKNSLKTISKYIIISAFTFFVLFPALWGNAPYVFEKISDHLFSSVVQSDEDPIFINNVGPAFYMINLVFKLSPVVLVLFIFSVGFALLNTKKNSHVMIINLIYICLFFIIFTLSSQKIDRYVVSIFLPIILSSSIYFSKISQRNIKITVLIVTACLFFYALYVNFPVMSGYYSPLIGSTKGAVSAKIYDNSGEYMYNAASYLNNIGRDINVFVPENIDSFDVYFGGKSGVNYDRSFDYAVLTLDSDRLNFVELPNCSELAVSFGPRNDISVLNVYKCKNAL